MRISDLSSDVCSSDLGWQAAYGYGEDDADDAGDATAKLPQLEKGQALPSPDVEAAGHTTQPPSRYTEATLVKALEEKGIGRPSTYASIMQTIQDRGYVWKKGQAQIGRASCRDRVCQYV